MGNKVLTDTSKLQKEKIRALVAGIYDIQKLRISAGNRIAQSFNIQMGQAPSTSQDEMDKEAKKLIDKLQEEYRLITDAYIDKQYTRDKKGRIVSAGRTSITREDKNGETVTVVKIKPNESVEKIIQRMNAEKDGGIVNIKSKMDYELICSYMELCSSEERQTKVLEKEVQQHPLWDMFFKDVKGCGPLMSAVCIAYFDVDKARHVSSFWKYAGLDTFTYMTSDGKLVTEGRSKKHAKFTKCTYIDRETGEEKEKYGLGYNPVLKTKLCGVLADCMIKLGLEVEKDPRTKEPILDANGEKIRTAKSKYVQAYLDYLCRINQRPDTKDYTAAHKHNMAKRYMIKQFVRDLWVVWRGAAGYEVSEPYEVAKLGNKPHKYNEAQCKAAAETKKCG